SKPTPLLLIPSGWITYHSTGGHYSISAPSDWIGDQYSGNANSTIVNNIALTPPNEPGIPSESLTITASNPSVVSSTISSHIGYDNNPSWFLEHNMYTMQF